MEERRVTTGIPEHRTVLRTDPQNVCEMSGYPGPQVTRRGFSAERARFSMLGGEFFTTCGATSTVEQRLDL